jgi:hypothetical protein
MVVDGGTRIGSIRVRCCAYFVEFVVRARVLRRPRREAGRGLLPSGLASLPRQQAPAAVAVDVAALPYHPHGPGDLVSHAFNDCIARVDDPWHDALSSM